MLHLRGPEEGAAGGDALGWREALEEVQRDAAGYPALTPLDMANDYEDLKRQTANEDWDGHGSVKPIQAVEWDWCAAFEKLAAEIPSLPSPFASPGGSGEGFTNLRFSDSRGSVIDVELRYGCYEYTRTGIIQGGRRVVTGRFEQARDMLNYLHDVFVPPGPPARELVGAGRSSPPKPR